VPPRADRPPRRPRGAASRGLVPGLIAVLAAACAPEPSAPRALEVTQFKQLDVDAVFLNEPLDLHFSSELDPASVTSASFRVETEAGRRAEGRVDLVGDRLRFVPRIARSPGLEDGGLQPDTAYLVHLSGFPRADGLRSLDGRPLAASLRLPFRTALERPFVDESPDTVAPLLVAADRIGELDPITLECGEPLDPTSLRAGDFELRRIVEGAGEEGEPATERVALRARLARNDRAGARIELRAVEGDGPGGAPRALAEGEYLLWVDRTALGLTDLGGHDLPSPTPVRPVEIVVERRPGAAGVGRYHEAFLGTDMRSPAALEGVDGTAWWSDTGGVTIRMPRAAGDGRDGRLVLDGAVERRDVAAVGLEVPAGRTAVLVSGLTPVVLRAQGRLRVGGTLARHTGWTPPPRDEQRPFGSRAPGAPERADGPGPRSTPTLTRWLEGLPAEGVPWTVLVAGGDLEVEGDVRTDGPLLLVAGGRVRVTGRVEASEVWILGEGGGLDLSPRPAPAALAFEEPEGNPLRGTLRLGVQSAPRRPARGVARWRTARSGGSAGAGSIEVRFVGERDVPGRGVEEVGPVDDPVLLEDCDAVRFLVVLELGPGGDLWDPPRLDFVELTWDERAADADQEGR
jgi:hypothetical protein